MSFYKELNFSYSIANDRLLDRINVLKVKDRFYTTILAKPQEYLHPELIDIFGSIGIQPQFITIFGIPNLSVGTSSIHTDIIYKNNSKTTEPVMFIEASYSLSFLKIAVETAKGK